MDASGMIQGQALKDQAHLYPTGLLLGLPNASLSRTHISHILPIGDRPLAEVLFTEGGLGAGPGVGAPPGGPRSGPGGAAPRRHRGGLKGSSRRRAVGPVQVARLRHATDEEDLDLHVQVRIWEIGICSIGFVACRKDTHTHTY